jgi:hypothetical protein
MKKLNKIHKHVLNLLNLPNFTNSEAANGERPEIICINNIRKIAWNKCTESLGRRGYLLLRI